MLKTIFAAALLVATAAATSANAVPITWTLQDVKFEDGGTAYGSFVYDADAKTLTQINITTTGNLAFTYTRRSGFGPFGFDVDTGTTVDGSGYLQLVVLSNFTNAGGVLSLGQNGDFEAWETIYVDGEYGDFTPPLRLIVAGRVTSSVPEPVTFTLFGAGLVGLAATRRRRKA